MLPSSPPSPERGLGPHVPKGGLDRQHVCIVSTGVGIICKPSERRPTTDIHQLTSTPYITRASAISCVTVLASWLVEQGIKEFSMQEFIIAIEALVLFGSALVAFRLLRRYANQRSADVDVQLKLLERLHSELLDGQACHHEHLERAVLDALTQSHERTSRTISDRIGDGFDAQLSRLDELLSSRTKELAAQVQDLLRTQADEHRQAEEGIRSIIKEEILTGLRGATQQVDLLRGEFSDLAQRVAPPSVDLSRPRAPSNLSMPHTSHLVLGAEESPLVRITALASVNERAVSSIPVPVTDSIRREVGPTLGHAARALLGSAQAAQRHLKMVFSPEIAQGLQDGTLHMMKSSAVDGGIRTMALDASGTIRGQASLVKGLNPASVAMGALQILSLIHISEPTRPY